MYAAKTAANCQIESNLKINLQFIDSKSCSIFEINTTLQSMKSTDAFTQN